MQCIDLSKLATTMDQQAWVNWIENDGTAVGFPKFDMFVNGYCSDAYTDPDNTLFEFCNTYWLTESGGWNAHRKLFGYVNLGKYNRRLMIKLVQAADHNHDGELDLDHDGPLYAYIVYLYKALLNTAR